MATIAGLLRSLQKTLRPWKEFEKRLNDAVRSYPPEWGEVEEEYREKGVELDRLKLRGIVQHFGATTAKQRHRIDPEAPARAPNWPRRTTDLVERLRDHPEDERTAALLRERGYELGPNGQVREAREGRGRRKTLSHLLAQEVALYLRNEYERVEAWDQSARVPGRLCEHVRTLLSPYFPDLTLRQVRNALEDADRGR